MAPLFRRKVDDDQAFEEIYERHVRDVYRYAAGMLGEAADAEDVTQTTFLNAYRSFQAGTRPDKPRSWLIAIAHNVCRQRFRQAQRRPREVEFDERVAEAAVQDPGAPSAEDLRRALSELPPNQRAALVMRELEGSSYTEIADVLGISVSALETLLFRARRALREQLEGQLNCEEAAFAIHKQLEGRLPTSERAGLRAHLRACPECTSLAQSQRAQRRALKSLVLVPLPSGLPHWFGGHAGAAGTAGGGRAGGVSGGGGGGTRGRGAGGGGRGPPPPLARAAAPGSAGAPPRGPPGRCSRARPRRLRRSPPWAPSWVADMSERSSSCCPRSMFRPPPPHTPHPRPAQSAERARPQRCGHSTLPGFSSRFARSGSRRSTRCRAVGRRRPTASHRPASAHTRNAPRTARERQRRLVPARVPAPG